MIAAQRVTWRVPAPDGLKAAWKNVQKLHTAAPKNEPCDDQGSDADWAFPLQVNTALAPLRDHYQAAAKEAAAARKVGYNQWVHKAMADDMGGGAKYAKPEQPADLSIVQVNVGQGPPRPGDAPARPRPAHPAWATNLDIAAARALQEWGDIWGAHGDGPTDDHEHAIGWARASAQPMNEPAARPAPYSRSLPT